MGVAALAVQLQAGHVNAMSSHRTRSFAAVTLAGMRHPLSAFHSSPFHDTSSLSYSGLTSGLILLSKSTRSQFLFRHVSHSLAESATSPAPSLQYIACCLPVPLRLLLSPLRFPCISYCLVDRTLHNTGTPTIYVLASARLVLESGSRPRTPSSQKRKEGSKQKSGNSTHPVTPQKNKMSFFFNLLRTS